MADPPSDAPSKALGSIGDLLKLVTSLATGALVFSIGLETTASVSFPQQLKIVLVAAWVLLLLSVIAGVWAQSLIPLQLNDGAPNINAADLRRAAMAMEALFVLGVVFLSSTLCFGVFFPLHARTVTIATASEAVRAAEVCGGPGRVVLLEVVKGADSSDPAEASWHVTLESSTHAGETRDVFVGAAEGIPYSPQAPCSIKAVSLTR